MLLASLLLLARGAVAEAPLHLTLPPAVYVVPGVPLSIYFDNIVLTEHPENFHFEVQCDAGKVEATRWTITPSDAETGDHAMEIQVKDAQGRVLEHAKTTLRIVPRDAGEERTLRLLIVGDSLTAATLYPNEIARLLSEPRNPKWKMLGTASPRGGRPGVAHEGYGGWQWSTFLSEWDPLPAGAAAGPVERRRTSPFLFANSNSRGGTLDLPRYFKEHCDNQPPDVVTFLLGINDCFRANPEDLAAVNRQIEGVLDNAYKLITAFHKAAPGAALAVGLTTPPTSREEGFEANYHGKFHRWGWKRIQHRLVERMIERFGKRPKEMIFLVPTELNLDPVGGYPNNNGVHPNATGYAQIGASFYAWMKAWMSGRL